MSISETDNSNITELHFPLSESDIINILKGVEYSMLQTTIEGIRICARIYTADRQKVISLENWHRILYLSYNDPSLMDLLRDIDKE